MNGTILDAPLSTSVPPKQPYRTEPVRTTRSMAFPLKKTMLYVAHVHTRLLYTNVHATADCEPMVEPRMLF